MFAYYLGYHEGSVTGRTLCNQKSYTLCDAMNVNKSRYPSDVLIAKISVVVVVTQPDYYDIIIVCAVLYAG